MPSSRELERAEDATEDPLDLAARAASVRRERSRALAFPESHPKQSGGEERPLKTIMKAAGQRRERGKGHYSESVAVAARPESKHPAGEKRRVVERRLRDLFRSAACVRGLGVPAARVTFG